MLLTCIILFPCSSILQLLVYYHTLCTPYYIIWNDKRARQYTRSVHGAQYTQRRRNAKTDYTERSMKKKKKKTRSPPKRNASADSSCTCTYTYIMYSTYIQLAVCVYIYVNYYINSRLYNINHSEQVSIIVG